MISSEKINEARKQLKNGVPDGEIKETLQREGYSKEDIDKVFEPKPYDMRSWYLVFGIVMSLAGIWTFMRNGSFLPFILAAFLFVQYYREGKRLSNPEKQEIDNNQS